MQMTRKDLWPTLKETVTDWQDDKAPKLAAALAYYTVISLAPLLVITIKLVGLVFRNEPEHSVEQQFSGLTGGVGSDTIADIVKHAGQEGSGTIATIMSIAVLLFGASGVFGELQDSLNTIWEVKPKPNRGFMGVIRDRFLSLTMVLGIAFLFMISLATSTAIGAISGGLIERVLSADSTLVKVFGFTLDLLLSTGVVILLFAAIYRFLPDVRIAWRDVWTGAIITGLLFQLGKYALTIYFNHSSTASAYGAAGSLIALLVWLYYSAQILFFGAEFTQVYARKYGSGIEPTANAQPVTDQERANLGVAPGIRSEIEPKPARAPVHAPRLTTYRAPRRQTLSIRSVVMGASGLALSAFAGAAALYAIWRQQSPQPADSIAERLARVNRKLDRLDQFAARATIPVRYVARSR
jgi:membrane protein